MVMEGKGLNTFFVLINQPIPSTFLNEAKSITNSCLPQKS
jgi:hypothetical protein